MDASLIYRCNEIHELHPLREKAPVFRDWPSFQSTRGDIDHWLHEGFTAFGLITSKIAVVDCDDKETGRQFFRQFRDRIKTVVLSPRGVHFWFKGDGTGNRQKVQAHGLTYDIRGVGGYVCSPGSQTSAGEYVFAEGFDEIDPDKLCAFDPAWSPPPPGKQLSRGEIKSVQAYLLKVESVGHGSDDGSSSLVRAAAICRDSGMSEAESLLALIEWNREGPVNPKWPDKELARAVTNVFKKG